MHLMSSWVENLNHDKEIWMCSSMMCSLVFEVTYIFKDAQEAVTQLWVEREPRQKRDEEEASFQLAQMHRPEVQSPPERRFAHFEPSSPPHISIPSPPNPQPTFQTPQVLQQQEEDLARRLAIATKVQEPPKRKIPSFRRNEPSHIPTPYHEAPEPAFNQLDVEQLPEDGGSLSELPQVQEVQVADEPSHTLEGGNLL
jgi:hypothetical protein